jgi:GNAT superfamily N-acetyltransferase
MRKPNPTAQRQPETRALTSEDAAGDFTCGIPELDHFFRAQAGQNQRRDISRTWVLPRPEGASELPDVVGFYTLTLGHLARETLPHSVKKRLPRYPLPVVIVGRLAVHTLARGRGHGGQLLHDAHLRALTINAQGGCVAVVVDAKDEEAQAFYQHYGYMLLLQQGNAPWPRRLYLPVATIRESLK